MYKTIKEAIELTNGLKRELFKINSDALISSYARPLLRFLM